MIYIQQYRLTGVKHILVEVTRKYRNKISETSKGYNQKRQELKINIEDVI